MKLFGKGAHRFPPLNPKFKKRCLFVSDHNRKEIENMLHGIIVDTPGHTVDSISLLLNDGTFFCGDAAMNGLPSMKRITIWAEDKGLFFQSWQTIIALKPAKIYPGHGKPFDCRELEENIGNVQKMKLYPLSDTK